MVETQMFSWCVCEVWLKFVVGLAFYDLLVLACFSNFVGSVIQTLYILCQCKYSLPKR